MSDPNESVWLRKLRNEETHAAITRMAQSTSAATHLDRMQSIYRRNFASMLQELVDSGEVSLDLTVSELLAKVKDD